jgi:hypothetical protein
MEDPYPEERSDYASEGTVAHEVSEQCLTKNVDATEFLGQTWTLFDNDGEAYFTHTVDGEMVDGVQMYVDYVRGQKGELLVERKVDFSTWVRDGFGTSDAIVIDNACANVSDLKFGRGVKVDATENPQAMLYGLGVLNDYEFIYGEFDTFKLNVIQPRLDHISEWEVSRTDLVTWAEETVKPTAEIVIRLLEDDDFFAQEGHKYLVPGESQCKFCKARRDCKVRTEHFMRIITDGFEAVNVPVDPREVHLLSNDDLGALLPQLGGFKDWLDDLHTVSQTKAEAGEGIPHHKLVIQKGKSSRSWTDDKTASNALNRAFKKEGIEASATVPISPAKAEKQLGKAHQLLKKYVVTKPGNDKTVLVHESDKRPAVEVNPTDGFSEAA